ncbi:hypothetical protein CONLIGDRAFT_587482, partial [Coniochaeta ligniaria NRRL 30616]
IYNKLKTNTNYYPTDKYKRIYIESCISNDVATNLEPYLDSEYPNTIVTST